MKRKTSSDNGAAVDIFSEQRERIRRETAAAYAKAKADKLPGKFDWSAFLKENRPAIEEFMRARHSAGLEAEPPKKAA